MLSLTRHARWPPDHRHRFRIRLRSDFENVGGDLERLLARCRVARSRQMRSDGATVAIATI